MEKRRSIDHEVAKRDAQQTDVSVGQTAASEKGTYRKCTQ